MFSPCFVCDFAIENLSLERRKIESYWKKHFLSILFQEYLSKAVSGTVKLVCVCRTMSNICDGTFCENKQRQKLFIYSRRKTPPCLTESYIRL